MRGKKSTPDMTFRRRIVLSISKGRIVTYHDSMHESRVDGTLPVFSTDTAEQAQQLQTRFCKKGYVESAYILAPIASDELHNGNGAELMFDQLFDITKMFDEFYSKIKTAL